MLDYRVLGTRHFQEKNIPKMTLSLLDNYLTIRVQYINRNKSKPIDTFK